MTVEEITWVEVIRSLATQLAFFLAALLAAAAIHKIVRFRHTRRVALRFAGVPPALTGLASAAAVGIELTAAVALVLPGARTAGAATAALLWSVYLILLFRAFRSGRRDVDCGCSFGMQVGGGHRPLGVFQFVRNVALVTLAGVVAAISARGNSDAAASQVLAAGALLALYAALDQVMTLRPLRSGELL